MKRLMLVLLLSMLLLTGCGEKQDEPSTPVDANPPAEVVKTIQVGTVVDALVVNVRIGPTTESRIIDTARRGDMFLIEGEVEGGGWYQVSIRGDAAYISADYLFLQTWEEGAELIIGTVSKVDSINIRSAPEPQADLVFSAEKNEQFIITAVDYVTGWHQLEYKGEPAYVSSEFVALREEAIEAALR